MHWDLNDKLRLTYSIMALWIMLFSGCATTPSKMVEQNFISHIYDNGNKQFRFVLKTEPKNKKSIELYADEQWRDGDVLEIDNGRARRRDLADKREKMNLELLKQSEQALANIMRNNQYCREGYFVFDRDVKHGNSILRGECQELATDSDRKNYPNVKTDVVRQSTFEALDANTGN